MAKQGFTSVPAGRMAKSSSIHAIVLSIAADVGQVLSDLRPHSPKTSVPCCRSGQCLPSEQQEYFTLELQNHLVDLKVYTLLTSYTCLP
jgi:hypothetical protein